MRGKVSFGTTGHLHVVRKGELIDNFVLTFWVPASYYDVGDRFVTFDDPSVFLLNITVCLTRSRGGFRKVHN